MTAITISREIGSQGDHIARKIAERLDFALVNKTALEKVFRQYGFVDFLEVYEESGFWARFNPQRAEMISMLRQVIQALVYYGNIVLVGRGGFALLKGYGDVLNVRIQAPFEIRVQRIANRPEIGTLARAEEYVRQNDALRRDFVNAMHAGQWDSAAAFDLVIDTAKINPAAAVTWLELAARSLPTAPTLPTTRDLQIDPVLLDSIKHVLDGK